ncbi:hypothetical protein SISNIDRAFT_482406 [Sistotremastrum niveocremeum HHB9708]|uniref:GIT Spa2 homology (SHD) domain-containing protein n=1 Tax=Sistotremastrum niveocremeum HHB9708 TaxID=1314777 RepID=A0A164Y5U5_9AGAM|nr:hypothetical protein SISNIDRAFT_482406 [Sistotremastrum niveocremeum HHB9708]
MANHSVSEERFRIVQHASGLPFELSESGSVVPTPSTLRLGFRFTLDGTTEEETHKHELHDEFFVTCFRAMNEFLSDDLIKEKKVVKRKTAREKIRKLTKHPFLELCTDVYDEMNRRTGDEEGELHTFPPPSRRLPSEAQSSSSKAFNAAPPSLSGFVLGHSF